MEELYLNNILIELPSRTIARTLQINDVGEVEDRQANYSNTIKIPRIFFSGSKFYIDSWRWMPFDKKSITHLVKNKRIIFSQNNKSINAIAVYTISEYFDKTLMLTILKGTQHGIKQIITYIQNYAFVSGFERIQILTRANQSPHDDRLEKKISFYLMTKKI